MRARTVYRAPSLAHTSADARDLARRQTVGIRLAAIGFWVLAGGFVAALVMEHVVEPVFGPLGEPAVEFPVREHPDDGDRP